MLFELMRFINQLCKDRETCDENTAFLRTMYVFEMLKMKLIVRVGTLVISGITFR